MLSPRAAALAACSCFLITLAPAREITVTPDTAAAGLQKIIDAAAPDDTIILKPGRYHEPIVLSHALHVTGEPGACIDPSEPLTVTWQAVPTLGPGVYRASVPHAPSAVFLDGKAVARLDEKRTSEPGEWSWQTLITAGPPLSGFQYIRGLCIYIAAEKTLYLHLVDNPDPAKLPLTVLWDKRAGIEFHGATGATVTGVTVAHAFNAVMFTGQSRNCTLSKCVIGPFEGDGVEITEGSTACLVEDNDITRGSLEEWLAPPYDVSNAKRREHYEVWQIHKHAGFYDRVGITLFRSGRDNRIHRNHIHETFDGIDVGDYTIETNDKPLVNPDDNRGTEIWENKIENTRDSGIELGTGCIDVQVHHNLLLRTHGGLRFKTPRIGPVYIYRNLLIDGRPFNIWFSMDDSGAVGYVYHNTIVGGEDGLRYSSMPDGIRRQGTPGWHFYNNIFVSANGFFRDLQKPSPPVNFICDYNLVVGGGRPYDAASPNDAHSLYRDTPMLTPDFPPLPTRESGAIDAGLDLSKVLDGKPLPGCPPGYFKGKAPDLGAVEVE